jgi:ABC-type multidrug transport system fused ATPase/permease subunit
MELPNKYDYHVGEIGSKLSGGERQRVLIARGLLKKDAKIYLFDEATSNLDAYTEREITYYLDDVMKNKTVVYCAHRLSSIINVDNIFVVKEGKVVEQGTHSQLISNDKSAYSEMWRNYLREKEKDVQ